MDQQHRQYADDDHDEAVGHGALRTATATWPPR